MKTSTHHRRIGLQALPTAVLKGSAQAATTESGIKNSVFSTLYAFWNNLIFSNSGGLIKQKYVRVQVNNYLISLFTLKIYSTFL